MNKDSMTNDTVEKLAYEVDNFISMMVTKHRLDPLTLSSVMTARLVLANDVTGSGDDFRELLKKIPEFKPKVIDVVH